MTDNTPPADGKRRQESAPGRDLAPAVAEALTGQDWQLVAELIEPLHAADLADLLEELGTGERGSLLEFTRGHLDPETLT